MCNYSTFLRKKLIILFVVLFGVNVINLQAAIRITSTQAAEPVVQRQDTSLSEPIGNIRDIVNSDVGSSENNNDIVDLSPEQHRQKLKREDSLHREQKIQEKNAGIDNRSVAEVQQELKPVTFAQTEAYFQVSEWRNLVAETYATGTFVPVKYMDIISQIMVKEAQFKDKSWAFYHTTSDAWSVLQDVYKQINNRLNTSKKAGDDFAFLRTGSYEGKPVKDFLIDELQENGLIDDNGNAGALLLSVNLSLFGNTDFKSESTWSYFMNPKKHKEPDRETYAGMMNDFGLTHEYIDELLELPNVFHTKQQTLLQIFVPRDLIDDVGYLAWATGIPAHEKTIDWVRENVANKNFKGKKGKPGALWALESLGKTFKNEQERNPMFKDLIKSVEDGDYSLDAYLKIYCTKPWDLPDMNYVQARLIFSDAILLNPASGVKMFKYTTNPSYIMEAYNKKLNEIVDKIVAAGKQSQGVPPA